MREKILKNVDLYIGDGSTPVGIVRRKGEKIYGHASMKTQLSWVRKFGIKKFRFTHVGEWIHKYDEPPEVVKDNTVIEAVKLKAVVGRKPFVIQAHFRGKSAHFDFRAQVNDTLEGFTMATARARMIKEPVETVKEGKRLLKDPRIWKVNLNTGEEIERVTAVGVRGEKIWCDFKARQPLGWLKVKGWTPPRKLRPVPGGTREYPGVFIFVDKGLYSKGADKPYFKEYFLYGKKWKGRIVFRLVPGMRAVRKLLTWLYWKPEDQTPYVLGTRAIKEEWLPQGYSALPFELEKKVPDHLNYWKPDLKKSERLERRKEVRKLLIEKEVKLAQQFILTRRHWRGQFVIRGLPVEDWHIKLNKRRFHLDFNPIIKARVSALEFKGQPGFFIPGEKKPNTPPLNPNKKIPAYVEILDKGPFEIEKETDELIHVYFKGKKLKGLYIFKRPMKDKMWSLIKQKAPVTK